MLTFNAENKKEMIQNEELMKVIVSACHNQAESEGFRKSAHGILFQMRDLLVKDEKYCNLGKLLYDLLIYW